MENDLYEVIKEIVRDELTNSNPMIFATGTVESVDPIKIRLDQKTVLYPSMVRLPRSCADYSLEVQISGVTDSGGDTYSGTTTVTVKNALSVGESVLLLRDHGGQGYTVIDRLEDGS
jgi:hypothetical protein